MHLIEVRGLRFVEPVKIFGRGSLTAAPVELISDLKRMLQLSHSITVNSSVVCCLSKLTPGHVTYTLHRHTFLPYTFHVLLPLLPFPESGRSLKNRGITRLYVKSLNSQNRNVYCCRHKSQSEAIRIQKTRVIQQAESFTL